MLSTERSVGILAGSEIRIDMMSAVVLAPMVWHMAVSIMPALAPEIATVDYWAMAGLTAVSSLASIVLREIIASAVAPRGGARTLAFYTTGAVSITHHNVRVGPIVCEWLVATLSSLLIATSLLWLFVSGFDAGTPLLVPGIVLALIALNVALCALDTLPVYPNRGGRVLAAILSRRLDDPARALRLSRMVAMAVCIGSAIGGLALIAMGWWGTGGWVLAAAAILAMANFNAYRYQRRNR